MRRPHDTLVRFDRAERMLHWTNAAIVGVLLLTGAALYVGPLSTIVGRRALVKNVHVLAGLAMPLPFVLAFAGPWRRALRADVRALNRWDAADRRWFRTLGRDASVRLGKFNPGQKLNAAFVAGGLVVMLASGAILKWYGPFPDGWRTGATFVHDATFLALAAAIAGHSWLALRDPEALGAMVRGWVPTWWARRHAPAWHDEQLSQLRQEAPRASPVAESPG